MRTFQLVLFCALVAVLPRPAQSAVIYSVTTSGVLVAYDSSTPGTLIGTAAISNLQAGESVLGIDFRPATGQLYALGSTSRLYTLNTATGAATQVGSAGAFTLSGTAFGFDFNPTVDRIRVTSNTGQNLRLNPNDGSLTGTDTALAYAAADTNFGATPRVVGSAYTNNFAGAGSTTLYAIDSNLDILATQLPPNNGTLNTVGALGFNTSDLAGFDIEPFTNVAFASLAAPTGSASQLFTINLTTGAATLVGTIVTGGSLITDIAVVTAAVPEPGTWTLCIVGIGLFAMRRFR